MLPSRSSVELCCWDRCAAPVAWTLYNSFCDWSRHHGTGQFSNGNLGARSFWRHLLFCFCCLVWCCYKHAFHLHRQGYRCLSFIWTMNVQWKTQDSINLDISEISELQLVGGGRTSRLIFSAVYEQVCAVRLYEHLQNGLFMFFKKRAL